MRKTITVSDLREAKDLEQTVRAAMDQSVRELTGLCSERDSFAVFSKIKFGGVGCDPLNTKRQLNLIEQVNQSFTYLASFSGAAMLFEHHPDMGPFTLNLGTVAGSDIESQLGELAAEVFASVTPSNNQKLKKDIDKVAATSAATKYSFFMCPGFEPGRQPALERDGVRVWSLPCPM